MRLDRRPIFATLLFTIGLSLAGCVERKDPVAPPAEPPQEDPGDFTADQAYTEGTVLQLLFG